MLDGVVYTGIAPATAVGMLGGGGCHAGNPLAIASM